MGAMSAVGWGFLLALAASVGATLAVRTVARRLGVVAKPRPDRWHRKPTALLGGVGMYVAFLAAWALVVPRDAVPGDRLLLVCASAMFALGLVDDLVQLKPYAKLIAQISAATALTTWTLRLPWTGNPVLDQGITIFWIVGITNAENLLDNMDGLAAGVALIAAGFLTLFFVTSGQLGAAAMSAAFAGAVLGFLIFNWNPASIFMGDCGSLFLGFTLASLSLVSTEYRSRNVLAVLATPVMLLLLPIFDTTFVTVMRKMNARPISQGGRDHTSHRLVALGLSERSAVLVLYALAFAGGTMAFLAHALPTPIAVVIVPAFVLGALVIASFLSGVHVYRPVDDAAEAPGRAVLPTLAEFAYKRRIFEVLFDLAAILLSYYGAFLLHYEGELPASRYRAFLDTIPAVVGAQILVFLGTGLYRGLWGYANLEDTARIMRSVLLAVLAATGVVAIVRGLDAFSPVVLVVDGLLLLFAVAGSRVSFRLFRDWIVGRRTAEGRLALIYGAGAGGELLVRELRSHPELGLAPVGFLDDEPRKRGKTVLGLPVLGSGDDLPEVAERAQVQAVLVSTAKLDAARQRSVEAACRRIGVEYRLLRVSLETRESRPSIFPD